MAAFLKRALDLPATGEDFFTDDAGSIFEGDINRLAAAGITKGCNPPVNDRFCPDGIVTRGQMAAFLVRGFGYEAGAGGDLFVDDDGSIFESDIDRLGTAGVTKGCNPPANSRFCPNSVVTRGQMASFLSRALDLTPMPPSLDHSVQEGVRLHLASTAVDAGCTTISPVEPNGITEICDVDSVLSDGTPFWIRHGWNQGGWSLLSPAEQDAAIDRLENRLFRLSLDGTPLRSSFEDWRVDEELDRMAHTFNSQFPGSLNGTHRIVGEWVADGMVELRVILDLNVDG